MASAWVICEDTTSGEYDNATKPIRVFLTEAAAQAAFNVLKNEELARDFELVAYFQRQRAENPQPSPWNHDSPEGKKWLSDLGLWISINPEPERIPSRSVVETPIGDG